MRNKLLSLIFATSCSLSQAFAHDLPPAQGDIDSLKFRLEQLCVSGQSCDEKAGPEEGKLECMIDNLHCLKEEGEVEEGLFKFMIRDLELRFAYLRGVKEAQLRCPVPPVEGPGKGPGDDEDGNGEDKEKVEICHIPPGNPDKARTIRVSQSAVPAHLAHGDTEGACQNENVDKNKDKEKGKENKKKKNQKDKNKNKEKNKNK
jgi:hypothetical protein